MRPTLQVLLVASSSLMMARPLIAQRSWTMRLECRATPANTAENRQKADAWVRDRLKAFLPPPSQALRLQSLELSVPQVELALTQIMMQCQQYREGRLDYEQADIALSGFEDTIREFTRQLANMAKVLAAGGQVSQMAGIRKTLMTTAGVARQAALLGLDQMAEEAQKIMVETLINFSNGFRDTCWEQSFDDQIALGIQRQNQLLETGIDVTPCAKRKFTAKSGGYLFESCSFRGGGDWRITWESYLGKGVGSGKAVLTNETTASGNYAVDWSYYNLSSSTKGTMKLVRNATYDAEGNVRDLRYPFSAEYEVAFSGKGGIVLGTAPAGMQGANAGKDSFEVDAEVSEKPCRSLGS